MHSINNKSQAKWMKILSTNNYQLVPWKFIWNERKILVTIQYANACTYEFEEGNWTKIRYLVVCCALGISSFLNFEMLNYVRWKKSAKCVYARKRKVCYQTHKHQQFSFRMHLADCIGHTQELCTYKKS